MGGGIPPLYLYPWGLIENNWKENEICLTRSTSRVISGKQYSDIYILREDSLYRKKKDRVCYYC